MKTIGTLFFATFLFISTPKSFAQVGFSDFYQTLLNQVVQDEGVQLQKWNEGTQTAYKKSLNALEAFDLSKLEDPKEQLAFWINAHNFCVLKIIHERMPIEDVMAIEGFRDQIFCNVGGASLTLNSILNEMILQTFKNPKSVFALWWGTKGGPKLNKNAFKGKTLDVALEMVTRETLKSDRMIRMHKEAENSKVELSPILDWFRSDFGKTDDSVLQFVRQYVNEKDKDLLPQKYSSARFSNFDWTVDSSSKIIK